MADYLKRRQYSDPWQLKTQLVQESPTLVFQMRDCEIVSEVLQVMPNAGEIYIIGLLLSRGMQIQRSLRRVGPSGKRRSLQVLLESTKQNGVATHFFEKIGLNLAQKPLHFVGTKV